jgi:hypothetical protein
MDKAARLLQRGHMTTLAAADSMEPMEPTRPEGSR